MVRSVAITVMTTGLAVGIIGTGMLAVPILAGSASYAVAEAVGWHGGLYRTFREAKGFYSVIIAATLVPGFEDRKSELGDRVNAIADRYPLYEHLSAPAHV